MLNRPVARELQTELEPELLRAVPLNLCMSGWAKHFVPPDPGMFKVDHSNYDLSRQTEYYDEFLSHDWETSRWYKLCTMLMIYNSRAAFFCSLVVSIAVGILRATKILPDGLWIQLSVFAVFPLVLCFWQRIRIMFARPLVVFLDKLCIAQHDEELKQKGIFGLAGFLDHSRQLTIFWSHRYFSRLWSPSVAPERVFCFFCILVIFLNLLHPIGGECSFFKGNVANLQRSSSWWWFTLIPTPFFSLFCFLFLKHQPLSSPFLLSFSWWLFNNSCCYSWQDGCSTTTTNLVAVIFCCFASTMRICSTNPKRLYQQWGKIRKITNDLRNILICPDLMDKQARPKSQS